MCFTKGKATGKKRHTLLKTTTTTTIKSTPQISQLQQCCPLTMKQLSSNYQEKITKFRNVHPAQLSDI